MERETEILLAHVLKVSRSYLYAHPEHALTSEQEKKFTELVTRHAQGEPIAYLIGRREFWSLDLIVRRDTLIPRPETELLVEVALSKGGEEKNKLMADLGTGCGAIALAMAKEKPTWIVHATDFSGAALEIAKLNASRLQIGNVKFHEGSWCGALPSSLKFDLIVSNPPYIAAEDPHLQPGILCYEPRSALIAGKSGLEDLETIIQQAKDYLKPGGYLLVEHGYQQAPAVKKIFLQAGYTDITSHQDLAGLNRVIAASWLGV